MACIVGYIDHNIEIRCQQFLSGFIGTALTNFCAQLEKLALNPLIGTHIKCGLYKFKIDIGLGSKKITVFYILNEDQTHANVYDIF